MYVLPDQNTTSLSRLFLSPLTLYISPTDFHTFHYITSNITIHIPLYIFTWQKYTSLFFCSSFFFILSMGDNNVNLPPGFRFCPTDEELVVHFLQRKASLLPYHPDIIPDLDLYPYDPWDLDGKAMAEGNRWYFYSRRTQNRITSNGYWNSLGGDEPIFTTNTSKRVGTKKYYAFYIGELSEGVKTNWIMQEYRLWNGDCGSKSSKRRSSKMDHSKWVVCRVYEHNYDDDDNGTELSCLDEVFLSLDDDFDEISSPN